MCQPDRAELSCLPSVPARCPRARAETERFVVTAVVLLLPHCAARRALRRWRAFIGGFGTAAGGWPRRRGSFWLWWVITMIV